MEILEFLSGTGIYLIFAIALIVVVLVRKFKK
ncbi:hypothetical protein DSL99_134 [Leeuwenhoekiella marinoflava]|uniref:Uncharacterized protein n=1 Tax=Leeuwenhoekiella marinoflava TaxID=988 RepID=A0A4Q0PR26_9FLAO|nr:hypothetical protein DSL99_134 [Leeuwenhoekiella marinoflava]